MPLCARRALSFGRTATNPGRHCLSRAFRRYSGFQPHRTGCVIFTLTRERFAHWLGNLRLARLTGLFLFEFIVVLLGVLAAQAVAEWAGDKRLEREAVAQFEQARRQAINVARVQTYWSTVAPCLSERARTVARAAANGETMTASAIGRPALPMTQMPAWDEDVRRVALARFSEEQMSAIANMESLAVIMNETSDKVKVGWATFTMLDPANGQPSAVDRGNVRLAAISVIDHIRLLSYGGPNVEMESLAVPRAEWTRGNLFATDVDDCGLIRNWR